jgi:hypothetical protein
MKKLILIALVAIFAACDKPEVQEIINNTPDTDAQIVYSAKMINPAGTQTVASDYLKLIYLANDGSNKTQNITGGIIPSGSSYAYNDQFKLGMAKKATLQIESNLFSKGWTIEAEITKATKIGGIVSLKKQTLTANGEISVNID